MTEPLDLKGRLQSVLRAGTPERGHFRALQEMSSISADSWKAVAYDRQKPTLEMLSFACTTWPEMAFWLATGLTDEAFGHVAPEIAATSQDAVVSKPSDKSRAYLRLASQLQEKRRSGTTPGYEELTRLQDLFKQRWEQIEANHQVDGADPLVKLAQFLDQASARPTKGKPPLISRLVAELQSQRQWSDEGMAEILGMGVKDYVQARDGKAELLDEKQWLRITDRWAYDAVRDALLKVLPKDIAKKVRDFDIQRGSR